MPRTLCRSAALILAALCATQGAIAQAPAPATPPPAVRPAAAPQSLYKDDTGPFTIRAIDEDWLDSARTPTRTIPVRIFIPERTPDQSAGPTPATFPVIVFSPGLGGSRVNYAYFVRHLASHGFIVMILSHPGSDTKAAMDWLRTHGEAPARRPLDRLRNPAGSKPDDAEDDQPGGWLMTSINDPTNLRERPKDISFVIDRLAKHETLGPIANMDQIGVAGHSFGAYTSMALGGMTVDLPTSHGGPRQSFRDKRIKAVLPMSPKGAGTMGIVSGAWDSFATPVLFLTGTRDYGAGGRSASWRRQAFDAIRGVDDYLFTLDGAGHMTFGRAEGALTAAIKSDKTHSAVIRSLGTAFFDAYLRSDAEAKAWLQQYATSKPAGSTAEFKPATTSAKP